MNSHTPLALQHHALAALAAAILLSLLHLPVEARSGLYNTTAARDPNKLNVHIVSHTHCDPGWLHTYSQYHRGLVLDGHRIGGVDAILDTAVMSLDDNPDRTFVFADLAFFVKWWQELHPDTREVVRRLVRRGQLEFTNGGIVQHDEANSHYSAMVDQMSMGMRFLQSEFGVQPRIAWQLDGFGHSSSEALIKAQGGFEAIFFGRSDKQDMEQRKARGQLELVWRGSQAAGSESDLFASQYNTGNYGPPSMDWFFERRDGYRKRIADSFRDDPEVAEFNLNKLVHQFVRRAGHWAAGVQGSDVLFLWGSDFTHSDARSWFANIDKMIHYVNKQGKVNAFYSTPSRYLAAKRSSKAAAWPLKTDDFFPYGGNLEGTDYWTGYFSSRPTLKGMIRRASALLQATRQLEVLAELPPSSQLIATSKGKRGTFAGLASPSAMAGAARALAPDADTAVLEFALAIAHHHDAITGTQRLDVTADYIDWLQAGVDKALPKMLAGLQALLLGPNDVGARAPAAASGKQPASARRSGRRAGPAAAAAGDVPGRHKAVVRRLAADEGGSGAAVLAPAAQRSPAFVTHSGIATVVEGGDFADAADLVFAAVPHETDAAAQLTNTADRPDFDAAANAADADAEYDAEEAEAVDAAEAPAHAASGKASKASGKPPPSSQQASAAASSIPELQLSTCLLLNASVCDSSVRLSREPGGFLVVAFNPLPWPVSQGVRLPVANGAFNVTGPGGVVVPAQLLPLPAATKALWQDAELPKNSTAAGADAELALLLEVPALGHAAFRVKRTADRPDKGQASNVSTLDPSQGRVTLPAAPLAVMVDADAGGIVAVTTADGRQHNLTVELLLYSATPMPGSGAYTFKADGPPDAVPTPRVQIVSGPVVTEVRQTFFMAASSPSSKSGGNDDDNDDWTGAGSESRGSRASTLTTRLWRGRHSLEVEWTVGGLAPRLLSWEAFVRYNTSIESGGVWYTDANGREMQQRKRNYRPSFKLNTTSSQELPGNIYPMTTAASIRAVGGTADGRLAAVQDGDGANAMFSIATDRAQGAVSLVDGQLSILIHRESKTDDGKGMRQALLDPSVAVGTHILSFGACSSSGDARPPSSASASGASPQANGGPCSPLLHSRHYQQQLNDPLQLAFASLATLAGRSHTIRETSSGLAVSRSLSGPGPRDPAAGSRGAAAQPEPPLLAALPPNVHLLSLQWRSCSVLLLRLSHMFQAGEHPELSRPARLSGLHQLLPGLTVLSAVEATLFGERPLQASDQQPVAGAGWRLGQNLTAWDPPQQAAPAGASSSFKANRLVGPIAAGTMIVLNPMQIRAFLLTVQRQGRACVDPPSTMAALEQGGVGDSTGDDGDIRASRPVPAQQTAATGGGAEGGLLQKQRQHEHHQQESVRLRATLLLPVLPMVCVVLLVARVLVKPRQQAKQRWRRTGGRGGSTVVTKS